jgi:hypothetical protein
MHSGISAPGQPRRRTDVSLERVQLCVTRLGRCARSRGAGSCGADSPLLGRRSLRRARDILLVPRWRPSSTPDGPAVDTGWDRVVGIDTRSPIKRVLYLMQENRSFDHVLGALPGANGTTTGSLLEEEVPLVRCRQWLPGDLPHNHDAALASINGGRMDTSPSPTSSGPTFEVAAAYAHSQLHESDVPNYRHWARGYVLCDNFFASVPGASSPNHLLFVAGHSGGVFDNPGEHADRSVPRRWAMGKLGMRCSRGRLRPQPRRGRDPFPPGPSSATRQAIHSSIQERTPVGPSSSGRSERGRSDSRSGHSRDHSCRSVPLSPPMSRSGRSDMVPAAHRRGRKLARESGRH